MRWLVLFGVVALVGCGPSTGSPSATVVAESLVEAAARGDTASVIRLLDAGADIDAQGEGGRTAVMAATAGNHVDTVRALIEREADVDIRDARLDNPFLYAGAEGLLDVLRLTIDAGADPSLTNRFGGTALIPASERGHVEVVRELLEHSDVDVDHVNNLGWTALLEAIMLGDGGPRQQEVVRLLLDRGADPTIADRDGVTPLQHARSRGYTEIEQLLLAAPPHSSPCRVPDAFSPGGGR
jgi:ankyrin repeat protein